MTFLLSAFFSPMISLLHISGSGLWICLIFFCYSQSRFEKSDMKPESNMLGFFLLFCKWKCSLGGGGGGDGTFVCVTSWDLARREVNVSSAYSQFCAPLFQHHPSATLVKLKELFKEPHCFFTMIYWMSICLGVIIFHFLLCFMAGFSREM